MPPRNCSDARRGIGLATYAKRSTRSVWTFGNTFVRVGEFVKRFDTLALFFEQESRWSPPSQAESGIVAHNRMSLSYPLEIRRRQMQIEIATERLQALRDCLCGVIELWLARRTPHWTDPRTEPKELTVKCWACEKVDVPADPQHLGCCDGCKEKILTRKEVPVDGESTEAVHEYPLWTAVPRDIASAQGESSE